MHGHTRLELIWTVVPGLILASIAIVVFFQLPNDRCRAGRRRPDPRHRRGPPVLLAVRLPERTRDRSGRCTSRSARVVDLKVVSRGRDPQLVDPGARRQDPGDPGSDRTTRGSRRTSPARTPASAPSSAALYHASMTATVDRRSRAPGTQTTVRRPGAGQSARRSSKASARHATETSARAATGRTSPTTRCSRRPPALLGILRTASPARRARCRPSATHGRRHSSTRSPPT